MTRLFLAALSLAFASCDFEQVVDLETPDYTPRLVVFSAPTPGDVFTVKVARSIAALDTNVYQGQDLTVENAHVSLYDENDDLMEVLAFGRRPGQPFAYHSSPAVMARAGRRYTLRVTAPGFPAAEATTQVLAPVSFGLLTGAVTDGRPFAPHALPLRILLPDPAGEQVYRISIEQPFTVTQTDPDETYQRIEQAYFTSIDPSLRRDYDELNQTIPLDPEGSGGQRVYQSALLRDDLFDGQRRVVEVLAQFRVFDDSPEVQVEADEIIVTVAAFGADYVRYQQSIAQQASSSENPFAEPAFVYSNVEGGLGVFGGFSTYQVTAQIE